MLFFLKWCDLEGEIKLINFRDIKLINFREIKLINVREIELRL